MLSGTEIATKHAFFFMSYRSVGRALHKKRTVMEKKLYYCVHCGNVIEKLVDGGVPVVCCGEEMQELTTDKIQQLG